MSLKVNMVVGYLRELALELNRGMAKVGKPTWSELKASLLKNFQPFIM